MAESMCGPSNALQSFHKHSSVDRTLQQDRLARGRSEQQGFRSPPGLGANILDAEFEAFQASQPVLPGFEYQDRPFHNGPLNQPALQNNVQSPQLPAWALDFQSLHLNEQIQNRSPHLNVDQAPQLSYQKQSSWQQEFFENTNRSLAGGPHARRDLGPSPQIEGLNAAFQQPFISGPQGYLQPSTTYQNDALQPHKPAEARQQDTDQMFDREFAQVEQDAVNSINKADMENLQSQLGSSTTEQHEPIQSAEAALISSDVGDLSDMIAQEHPSSDQIRIGSDRILDEAQERSKEPARDAEADELARTAGTLLERVQDEPNQKFKQSTFLSLMRQLRDKDVFVEGDKLVYTSHSLHPGGQHYPNEQT